MKMQAYWTVRTLARNLAKKAGQNPDEIVSFGPPDPDGGENEGPIWWAFRDQARAALAKADAS